MTRSQARRARQEALFKVGYCPLYDSFTIRSRFEMLEIGWMRDNKP